MDRRAARSRRARIERIDREGASPIRRTSRREAEAALPPADETVPARVNVSSPSSGSVTSCIMRLSAGRGHMEAACAAGPGPNRPGRPARPRGEGEGEGRPSTRWAAENPKSVRERWFSEVAWRRRDSASCGGWVDVCVWGV